MTDRDIWSDPAASRERLRADPKPSRRIVDKRLLVLVVSEAEAALVGCQLGCGVVAPLSAHHIIPRSQGGDDVRANIAVLCGDGTRRCHGLIEAGDRRARHMLRAAMTPAQVTYGVGKVGAERFERRYPSREAS